MWLTTVALCLCLYSATASTLPRSDCPSIDTSQLTHCPNTAVRQVIDSKLKALCSIWGADKEQRYIWAIKLVKGIFDTLFNQTANGHWIVGLTQCRDSFVYTGDITNNNLCILFAGDFIVQVTSLDVNQAVGDREIAETGEVVTTERYYSETGELVHLVNGQRASGPIPAFCPDPRKYLTVETLVQGYYDHGPAVVAQKIRHQLGLGQNYAMRVVNLKMTIDKCFYFIGAAKTVDLHTGNHCSDFVDAYKEVNGIPKLVARYEVGIDKIPQGHV